MIEFWKYSDKEIDFHEMVAIRDALSKCPDEFPVAGTEGLEFIADEKYRESLRVDLSAVNNALSTGQWKAATVLAGSLTEALLLWALEERNSKEEILKTNVTEEQYNDIQGWKFDRYVGVAKNVKIITHDAAELANRARRYRNLIHPGKSKRRNEICNRETAFVATAAVDRVIRKLSENRP